MQAALTKEREAVTEQHRRAQVVNEVQVRETPPFTIVLKESGEKGEHKESLEGRTSSILYLLIPSQKTWLYSSVPS